MNKTISTLDQITKMVDHFGFLLKVSDLDKKRKEVEILTEKGETLLKGKLLEYNDGSEHLFEMNEKNKIPMSFLFDTFYNKIENGKEK